MFRRLAEALGGRLDRKSAGFVVQAYQTALRRFLDNSQESQVSVRCIEDFESQVGKVVLVSLAENTMQLSPTQISALSWLLQDDLDLVWDTSDDGFKTTVAAWVYVSSSRFHDASHEFQRTLSSFWPRDAPFFRKFEEDRDALKALLEERRIAERKVAIRAEAMDLGLAHEYETDGTIREFRLSYMKNGDPFFRDISARSVGEAKDKFLFDTPDIPRSSIFISRGGR